MTKDQPVLMTLEEGAIEGNLTLPQGTKGIVLFAHGSGSSRLSPRNQFVARTLNQAGLGTLLFDLLTKKEEQVDIFTAEYRFDIDLLAKRLVHVTDWLIENPETKDLNIGYFGSSTGAAAALFAAAERPEDIKAIVSRGGRPDLAEKVLDAVQAPTLLIVGGYDDVVIQMNESAFEKLTCEKEILILPGATHLFEEPGKLEAVSEAATEWFRKHLLEEE